MCSSVHFTFAVNEMLSINFNTQYFVNYGTEKKVKYQLDLFGSFLHCFVYKVVNYPVYFYLTVVFFFLL